MTDTVVVKSTCEIDLMVTKGKKAEGDKPAVAPEVRKIPPGTTFKCPADVAIVDVKEVTASEAAAKAEAEPVRTPTVTTEKADRSAMEKRAEELGIRVNSRWKDETLETKIAEAERALNDDPL